MSYKQYMTYQTAYFALYQYSFSYKFYVSWFFEIYMSFSQTPMKQDIIQMHFTSWPDHGTPEELDLVQFHRAVMKIDKAGSPLLVHCRLKMFK